MPYVPGETIECVENVPMTIERHRIEIHPKTFNCGRNISLTPAIHIAGRIDTSDASERQCRSEPAPAEASAVEDRQHDNRRLETFAGKGWAER